MGLRKQCAPHTVRIKPHNWPHQALPLAGSSEYGPHPRQFSSCPGTGSFSPLFPQLVLPQWHLSASLRAMKPLSVRMQPCVVLKPDPQWVLRPGSCQLCREPRLWAKQAGNAPTRQLGCCPLLANWDMQAAPHHRSVEAQFLASSPAESTWLWKLTGRKANILELLKT